MCVHNLSTLRTKAVARQAVATLTAAMIALSSSACGGVDDSAHNPTDRDAGRNKPATTSQTAEPGSDPSPAPR